jgi:subtilisin family serine protease
MDAAGIAEAPPPPPGVPGPLSREAPEKIVRGGFAGLSGKGVIIAVLDSGVDFRNPDFITYDAQGRPTSRLLYLWDTTSNAFDSRALGSKAPITYPNGASVGTLYTREQLTAELRSLRKRIPETDLNGHGTACAGIAAGNGNNAKGREEVIGVAPEADIIGVRIGGAAGYMENSYLLGAICGWLDSVAGARPLVVSCSFGGHAGGHDGALVAERQLDARFPAGARGRAVVVAAGNDAVNPIHAEVKFKGKDAPGRLIFAAGNEGAQMLLYLDTANIRDVRFAPAGQTKIAGIQDNGTNPFTKQAVASVIVPPGLGGFFIYNLSGAPMRANVYVFGGAFHTSSASQNSLVASPGTSSNVITVASYDWNDQFEFAAGRKPVPELCNSQPPFRPISIGKISCYSSPGYRRDGTIKPEIAAPGQWYHASYAKTLTGAGANAKSYVDASGNYCLFNGTSAATPYVAGIVALMMQKKPAITFGEIKSLMKQHASSDRYTDDVPNVWFGHGKLDLKAVERIVGAIR